MITKRDQDIINFVTDFHIATSKQIHSLFFENISYRYTRKRLQYLSEILKEIKPTHSTIDNCIAYYTDKKPVQIHHDLIRAELFVNLKKQYNVLDWSNETPIVNIRPDALSYINNSFAYINNHGIVFPIFIEIHLNNKFNFQKYIDLVKNNNLHEMFGIMPRVLICTDRQLTIPTNIGIKFKAIDIYNMNGLNTLFK